MDLNPTTIAIPLYFFLMGIELLVDRYQNLKLYRLNDSITNINAGASQQVVAVLMHLIPISIYELVYHNASFRWIETLNMPSWALFWVAFILWDFCYYWAHRMSHEVNLFWSAHVVHHQSEEYNLSVALRQSWFQGIWTSPFYIPMALLGFSTETVIYVSGINLIYQFWIHTEVVNRMGFLEYFMNTPSHHRVHHGRNPKYIDRNHAGVFIVWDRLFGTFQAEEERPTYGITSPVNSWNPVWVNFAHLELIWKQVQDTPLFFDKLRVVFYPPGWQPAEQGGQQKVPEISRDTVKKYDTSVKPMVAWYVVFQYVILTVGIAFYLFEHAKFDMPLKLGGAGLIVLGVWTMGGFFENKKITYWFEYFRIAFTVGFLGFWLKEAAFFQHFMIGGTAYIIVSYFWLWKQK